jgi:hypothetical protein
MNQGNLQVQHFSKQRKRAPPQQRMDGGQTDQQRESKHLSLHHAPYIIQAGSHGQVWEADSQEIHDHTNQCMQITSHLCPQILPHYSLSTWRSQTLRLVPKRLEQQGQKRRWESLTSATKFVANLRDLEPANSPLLPNEIWPTTQLAGGPFDLGSTSADTPFLLPHHDTRRWLGAD